MSRPRSAAESQAEHTGCLGGFARIIWMLVGNAALVLLFFLIMERGDLSGIDIAFWAVIIALIGIRFIDITRLNGLTSNAEPATIMHWRRYAILLLIIAGSGWILAHIIARFTAR